MARKNKVKLSPQLRLGVGRGYPKNNLLKYSGFLFLLLSLGLGVWTVAMVIKHSGDTQVAQNNPQILGAKDNQSEQPFIEYTVVKDDTVFNIAQKHNVSWTSIATINNLSSPFTLKPGQKLKIPR
jgi:hypothetical protein